MGFQTTFYTIKDERIEKPLRLLYLSDLHGKIKKGLPGMIREAAPDLILLGGDIITRKNSIPTLRFLRAIQKIAPVYYGYGNHEMRRQMSDREYAPQARCFMAAVKRMGIRLLNDESVMITPDTAEPICLTGITLPLVCYKRFRPNRIPRIDFPVEDPDAFRVLLVHTPANPHVYAEWGADLTLCGHYHGAVMRLGKRGLITPQLHLFERYAHGIFEIGARYYSGNRSAVQHLIVSSGAGGHKFPPRIFNPAEIVIVDLLPENN